MAPPEPGPEPELALELDAPRGKLDLKCASKRRGGLAALPAQRERRPPFPPSAARLCEGVEEDAADGDGGSERAGRSERVAEDDEGDEDDGDAPMGVEPMGSESLREVHGVPCREAEGRGGRGEAEGRRGGEAEGSGRRVCDGMLARISAVSRRYLGGISAVSRHALDGVGDGVRHRVNLHGEISPRSRRDLAEIPPRCGRRRRARRREGEEGALIVKVVRRA